MPFKWIEIGPRCHGNPCSAQNFLGQNGAVMMQMRNFSIDIESPICGKYLGDPKRLQPSQQNLAVLLVTGFDLFKFRDGIESGQGGILRQAGRRNEQILSQPFNRAHQPVWHHHPANPPTGHGIVFRKTIDDDGIPIEGKGCHRRLVIGQTMIDFIGNHPQAQTAAGFAKRLQSRSADHRPRRVCRTGQQKTAQARRPAVLRFKCSHRWLITVRRLKLHQACGQAQRFQDVSVTRITGRWGRNLITGIESRQKG